MVSMDLSVIYMYMWVSSSLRKRIKNDDNTSHHENQTKAEVEQYYGDKTK